MTDVVNIIIGFVLTGVIANRLLLRWQQRSWYRQQQFLGHEKEYYALKDLADEVSTLLGARIYHMQRATRLLNSPTLDVLNQGLSEYTECTKKWNERLTSFYVRLPILADVSLGMRLDKAIQQDLYITNREIEKIIATRRLGGNADERLIKNIERQLTHIQGKARTFNDDLLSIVEKKRQQIYYGKQINMAYYNIESFSTWELFKALFVRNVNSFSVVRSFSDFK